MEHRIGYVQISDKPHTHRVWYILHTCMKRIRMGHGPQSSTLVVTGVVRLLFVLFYVLFVCKCVPPPGDNPIVVNKYIKISKDN